MGEKIADYGLYFDEADVPPSSDLIDGSDVSNLSDYKLMESSRIKESWEGIIRNDPEIHHTLNEVDHILRENSHDLETHITGEDYLKVSNGEKTRPDKMHLRISQTPEQLQSIENHFFQNITDTGTLYRVGDTRVAFELGPLYDETVPIKTGFDRLNVKAPTHESFFNLQYSQALEELSGEYGVADINDVFSEYF